MLDTKTELTDFVTLKTANEDLQQENARLLEELLAKPDIQDTIRAQRPSLTYDVMPATVINNNIMSLRNHMTLDVGRDQGVSASMGVITSDGVVGVVKKVGKSYSSVLSLLHVDTRISASIKDDNFFGTLSWKGDLYNEVFLSDIPTHARISIGDSITTNGYSTIFPKGINIGVVKEFGVNKNGAFYDVKVTPTVDFTNLERVYLLKGTFDEELISISSDE